MSRLVWAAIVVMLLGAVMLVTGGGMAGAWVIFVGIVLVAADRWTAQPHTR